MSIDDTLDIGLVELLRKVSSPFGSRSSDGRPIDKRRRTKPQTRDTGRLVGFGWFFSVWSFGFGSRSGNGSTLHFGRKRVCVHSHTRGSRCIQFRRSGGRRRDRNHLDRRRWCRLPVIGKKYDGPCRSESESNGNEHVSGRVHTHLLADSQREIVDERLSRGGRYGWGCGRFRGRLGGSERVSGENGYAGRLDTGGNDGGRIQIRVTWCSGFGDGGRCGRMRWSRHMSEGTGRKSGTSRHRRLWNSG